MKSSKQSMMDTENHVTSEANHKYKTSISSDHFSTGPRPLNDRVVLPHIKIQMLLFNSINRWKSCTITFLQSQKEEKKSHEPFVLGRAFESTNESL